MNGNWRQFLTVRGVLLPPPEVRRCPTDVELRRCESRLRYRLPESYREFCSEIGAGSLGHVDFLAPGLVQPKSIRKRDRLVDHARLAGRAIEALDIGLKAAELVSFASTADGDWFFWLSAEMSQADPRIFVASVELPQAQACAEGLDIFIRDVCLGERLIELGLYEELAAEPVRMFMPVQ